jgi:tagatose-1,6-bisphosphate aldolase
MWRKLALKMTQGKFKRLNAVAGKNGVISAAAMDQRGRFRSQSPRKGIDQGCDTGHDV